MASLPHDKANAMRRFQMKQTLENVFHLFNVFAAFFLLFRSSWFPITLQSFSHLYALLLPFFHNSFYAFLLLNAIILFLFASSHQFLTLRVTTPQEQPPTLDSSSPVFKETVTAVTEITLNGEEASEKKRYRRVRSESYERRRLVGRRRELKRWNSNVQLERRLCCVEQLNEEEFNRAVEDFIAKHKRMQMEEQIGIRETGYLAITQ